MSQLWGERSKGQIPNSESVQGIGDPCGKASKKRKDQNEEEDEDSEENVQENEDSSAQKKPRVVWSVELHGKFVAAVNQLGIDKVQALPEKAQYGGKPKTNMATILGGRNSSYANASSLDGYRNFHAWGASSRQLPALTSFQPNGLLGRMNSSTAFGMHRLVPSQTVHLGNNTSNGIYDLWKLQGTGLLRNHQGNSLQGMPSSMGLDQLQRLEVV